MMEEVSEEFYYWCDANDVDPENPTSVEQYEEYLSDEEEYQREPDSWYEIEDRLADYMRDGDGE